MTFTKVLRTLGSDQDLHVFVNGVEVFSELIPVGSRAVMFHDKFELQAGDTIDIGVGASTDGGYGDVMFIDASVHLKPEA